MEFTTNLEPKSAREIAYYATRHRSRFHARLLAFIVSQMKARNITSKQIAERIGKDPAQLSRILSKPSNLTLDSVSEILLGVDAEQEPPEFICFSDISPRQYAHPLIARGLGVEGQAHKPGPRTAVTLETSVSATSSEFLNHILFHQTPAGSNAAL